MRIHKITAVVLGLFVAVLTAASVFLPKEREYNRNAEIKIGAGDDISGLLMEETVNRLNQKYKISTTLESSSFQDCCSNTAQWALNAKEINLGFFCTHIARHTIENNKDVEIYGPVIMNGETIVYKNAWDRVQKVGVTQGREQSKALAAKTYDQIEGFNEITQKGILYAMEDEQVDAAILDVTKAAQVPGYECRPLSGTDYISYVLVADKEFARSEAFQDFICSYNEAAETLGDTAYMAEVLGVDTQWVEEKNIKFLPLEETGVDENVNFSTGNK